MGCCYGLDRRETWNGVRGRPHPARPFQWRELRGLFGGVSTVAIADR